MKSRRPSLRALRGELLRSPLRRIVVALFAVLALTVALPNGSGGANPSSTPSMTFTALSPASQPSGTTFSYQLTYTCSNINAVPCAEDPVITIPLGAAASWPVDVGANPLITSWTVTGGSLVIHLADLTEGVAGNIGITITPPNHTTPNNTSWSLTPVMGFSDGTPSATGSTITSTATASPSLSVAKRPDQTFYRPGDTVTYRLTWDCPGMAASTGVEDQTSIKLVDTLPAGLTYASSSPVGATVSGQVVTFNLTAAQIGERCRQGAGTPIPVSINATVNSSVPDGTVLRNRVTATSTSISGATRTSTQFADITIVDAFPGAVTSKAGYGPLLNNVGDAGFPGEGYYSATYPGAWLGHPSANDPTSSIANGSVFLMDTEAIYELKVEMPSTGLQHAVVDPMPCTTNNSGANYTSNAPGTLCTDPAFHPTMVTVHAGATENPANVGIPSAFTPQARLTDGTLVDLVAGPVSSSASTLASGPSFRSYYVPASDIGQVAELIFPRTAGMTNTNVTYTIGGYADADRVQGDILRNQAEVSSYTVADTTPYDVSPSSMARIFVVEGPTIGLNKQAVDGTFWLTTHLFVDRPVAGDLTFVDRLPAGVSYTGPVTASLYSYRQDQTVSVTTDVTTTVDPATGQSIVTFVVDGADINALMDPGLGDQFNVEVQFDTDIAFPGNYTNEATVNLDDVRVDDTLCTAGDVVAGTSGADFECADSVGFTIDPDPTSDAVQVSKSVKGSLDTDFKTFPAIGHVAAAGGSATFKLSWTNKSADPVGDVVAYDLLPRVGDTGTVAGTVNQQRGSTFRPTLTGIGTLPAGVTAYYSTSTNPCRPEVLPNASNPGCVDDWTALPASPSPTLLDSIRALKFASASTYAFDEGFAVDIDMTTPPLASADEVAWNTFASAQTNTVSGNALPPVESAKVGIARMDFKHIAIDKVVDQATANVGDTLTYTVKALNDGGRDLTDVTLRDVLPAGTTFVSASNGGVHSNGEVTWDLASMPLGQQFTFTITVKITGGEGSNLVNEWGVDTPDIPVDAEHPCTDTPTKSCATTHVPSVPLTFAKTSDPVAGTAVKPGDTVTYTVTVTNATANTSTAGLVTDDLSGVLAHASITSAPALTCSPSANSCGKVTYASGDTEFTWSSTSTDPMAGNTVATITYTVKVDAGATGTLRNVLVEPDIQVDHPIISWDKVVDKGANALVAPGETLTYTISVTNTGSVDSEPFSVFDDLTNVVNKADFVAGSISIDPAGLGAAAYDAGTKHLTWTGSLDASQTVEVSYQVTVKDDAFGQLKNAFLDKQVINPIAASLRWRKVGPDAQLLGGAEWKLLPVDGNGDPAGPEIFVADCTQSPCTGQDTDPVAGQFLVNGLVPGPYRIVEVKAPKGFVLNGSPIAVVVAGTTSTTDLADVVNDQQHGLVLPFAGGIGTDHLTIAGGSLFGLTAGLAAWQRKRRRAV